jgi:peroxiredoxin
MPDFEEAYKVYGKDIHFLMVNLTDGSSETVESASAFIAEQGYTFPVYYDTAFSGANAYGIRSIPMTFFIDAQGDLVSYGEGMLSAEMLQKGISLLLPAETK